LLDIGEFIGDIEDMTDGECRIEGRSQNVEAKPSTREAGMLTAYIHAALRKAHYQILPEGEGYFGVIEGIKGVWAQADTLEACREELREVLEEWIILGLKMGHPLPPIDDIVLTIEEVA
jgi:predicted RNase H-like HicB family nuclease